MLVCFMPTVAFGTDEGAGTVGQLYAFYLEEDGSSQDAKIENNIIAPTENEDLYGEESLSIELGSTSGEVVFAYKNDNNTYTRVSDNLKTVNSLGEETCDLAFRKDDEKKSFVLVNRCNGDTKVRYTKEGSEEQIYEMTVKATLPEMGYYTSSEAKVENYIRDINCNDITTFYLIFYPYEGGNLISCDLELEDSQIPKCVKLPEQKNTEQSNLVYKIEIDKNKVFDYAPLNLRAKVTYNDGQSGETERELSNNIIIRNSTIDMTDYAFKTANTLELGDNPDAAVFDEKRSHEINNTIQCFKFKPGERDWIGFKAEYDESTAVKDQGAEVWFFDETGAARGDLFNGCNTMEGETYYAIC